MKSETLNIEDFKNDLKHFTGSENFYKSSLGLIYTDGIQHVAETVGAYWLIDLVGSVQYKLKSEPFQSWDLKVKDSKGVIVCTDGNDNVLYTQEIPFTDFPLEEIQLFAVDNTLMLTSEY